MVVPLTMVKRVVNVRVRTAVVVVVVVVDLIITANKIMSTDKISPENIKSCSVHEFSVEVTSQDELV